MQTTFLLSLRILFISRAFSFTSWMFPMMRKSRIEFEILQWHSSNQIFFPVLCSMFTQNISQTEKKNPKKQKKVRFHVCAREKVKRSLETSCSKQKSFFLVLRHGISWDMSLNGRKFLTSGKKKKNWKYKKKSEKDENEREREKHVFSGTKKSRKIDLFQCWANQFGNCCQVYRSASFSLSPSRDQNQDCESLWFMFNTAGGREQRNKKKKGMWNPNWNSRYFRSYCYKCWLLPGSWMLTSKGYYLRGG